MTSLDHFLAEKSTLKMHSRSGNVSHILRKPLPLWVDNDRGSSHSSSWNHSQNSRRNSSRNNRNRIRWQRMSIASKHAPKVILVSPRKGPIHRPYGRKSQVLWIHVCRRSSASIHWREPDRRTGFSGNVGWHLLPCSDRDESRRRVSDMLVWFPVGLLFC